MLYFWREVERMAQTNVSFEMNEKLRDEMAELCDELGMNIDDAFQIFARKMVNEQEIPFEVTEKELPASDKEEVVVRILKWTSIAALCAATIALIVSLFKAFKR